MSTSENPKYVWRLVVTAARPTFNVETNRWRQPAMSSRIVAKILKQIRDSDHRAVPEIYEWAQQEKSIAEYMDKSLQALKADDPSSIAIPELPQHLKDWIFSDKKYNSQDIQGVDAIQYIPAPGVPPYLNVVASSNCLRPDSHFKSFQFDQPDIDSTAPANQYGHWKDPLMPWKAPSKQFSDQYLSEFWPKATPELDAYYLLKATVSKTPKVVTGIRRHVRVKGHKYERDLPKRLARIEKKLKAMPKVIKRYEKQKPKHIKLTGIERIFNLGKRNYTTK